MTSYCESQSFEFRIAQISGVVLISWQTLVNELFKVFFNNYLALNKLFIYLIANKNKINKCLLLPTCYFYGIFGMFF